MNRIWVSGLGWLLSMFLTAASLEAAPDSPPPADRPVPRTLKALAAGPVHEAFLSTRGDLEPTVLPESPPPSVIERPAIEPADGRAVWIGGYWDWEPGRGDFVWVTGTWRVAPPGRLWVNTYWKRDEHGWRRISGFWSDRRTSRLDYRTEGPPTDRPAEDPGPPPKANCFYIPGEYVPDGAGVVWKKGYWADDQPGWSWVPARWIRQPEGWVFQDGFWDRPLEARGILFAPAALEGGADPVGQLFYSPYTIISPELYGQLYGAFGRAGSNYDGYAGASYDDDGRYYFYADYGMLSNYYGYLDYPNLGAFGYPYYVSPLTYQSLGYSFPTGLIGGLYYGGLGYGVGNLGLGIVNPAWGYPMWSGGGGYPVWNIGGGWPSWTGNSWAPPGWGNWAGWPWGVPGWSWGFPGWGWGRGWYWPSWGGGGGGVPLIMSGWGWNGIGLGGFGLDGLGLSGLNLGGISPVAASLSLPSSLLAADPPGATSSLPFGNTGRGHLVSAATISRPSAGGINLANRGGMRQAAAGAGVAPQVVKPPPASRPFANLASRPPVGFSHMRIQSNQPAGSTPSVMRQAALATGAGSWNHSFNGATQTLAQRAAARNDAFTARAATPAGVWNHMRSAPGANPAALGPMANQRPGFNPATRGATVPPVVLQGMRQPGFNAQSRGVAPPNLGANAMSGRAPQFAGPNLGATRGQAAGLANPGFSGGPARGAGVGGFGNPGFTGGAMRGGGFSNPGFSGGAMRGGGSLGGFSNPGFTGGGMRGASVGGVSPGFSGGTMGGGSFGGVGSGFSGGAMRGGGGIGGGGFGGGMGGGLGGGAAGSAGGGGFGASGFGGGFGGAHGGGMR